MISRESFQKREHLLRSRDFREVYKGGRSFKKESVVLYCLPNGLGYNRLGFSISSRNIKRACRRNRLRRVFRDIYRRRRAYFKSGFDMVIVVKRDLGTCIVYEDLEKVFLKIMEKLGILA
jgi:ribonuclease P protein component